MSHKLINLWLTTLKFTKKMDKLNHQFFKYVNICFCT